MADDATRLGVAVIGFGWMGRVHTQGYARLLHHFPGSPLRPVLVAVADEVPGRAEEATAQFGFTDAVRDWRNLADDPRVQAVSITAPNFLHREIGVAMAETGKHIWIEKPVGLTTDDARAVRDAATTAGVQGTVGSALSMSVDDLKVVEAHGFATSIAKGVATGPTLDDAVRSAVALDAMATSAQTGAWVRL